MTTTALRTLMLILCMLASVQCLAENWAYTVREGDTLWALCQKYTDKPNCWQELGPHNDVSFPKTLAPGTRINFPVQWLRQQPQPVIVTYVRGAVSVSTKTGTSPATRAMQLGIGTIIEVGKNSALTLRFADGSSMRVEEDTSLRLDRLSAFGATGMVDTRIFLERGALQTTVPRKDPPTQFRVRTPSAVAAVRGTAFRVTQDENQRLTNGVYEGNVVVSNELGEQNIPKGYGTVAEIGAPPTEAVELLAAPKFYAPKKGEKATTPYLLDWSSIHRAETYRTEIMLTEQPDAVIFSATTTESQLMLDELAHRCYLVRVSAIDTYKLVGLPATKELCLLPPEPEKPWGLLTVLAIALGLAL